MEALMLTFQHSCEQSAPTQTRKAVLAADETFFGGAFDSGIDGFVLRLLLAAGSFKRVPELFTGTRSIGDYPSG